MPADRTPEGMAFWRQGLARFAVCPNVLVKLSGLGTFTRRCRREEWQPVIETTIDLFGPGRCMFGSNFPVEKLWTTSTGSTPRTAHPATTHGETSDHAPRRRPRRHRRNDLHVRGGSRHPRLPPRPARPG